MEEFKDRLDSLLKSKNMNNVQLGKIINKSSQMIGQYIKGESIPSIDVAKSIAKHFEISLDYLIMGNKTGEELIEQQLIENYRELSYDDKLEILGQVSKLRAIQIHKETLKKD